MLGMALKDAYYVCLHVLFYTLKRMYISYLTPITLLTSEEMTFFCDKYPTHP